MIELVTKDGWKFYASAEVTINGETYDMDQLTETQKQYVGGKLNEQALNAAYSGRATVKVNDLPTYGKAFDCQ